MRFSDRIPRDLYLNPISRLLETIPADSLLDLTQSNPTLCGFDYPPDLLKPFASPSGLKYEPHPFGRPEAREAVADYLTSSGRTVRTENILLTASTSEAYSYLFKLLADPGDSFLVPRPGYPLLDHLVQLEGAKALPYALKEEPHWPIHWESLERAPEAYLKGLVVVNPHNPTGCFISPADQIKLADYCRKRDLAYISDEVFSEFAYPGQGVSQEISQDHLSFRLGGLSKSLGLPQLKLSWVVMDGPDALLAKCRERLDLIADTYLSVGTPVQLALKDLFLFAPNIQKQVLERVLSNRARLSQTLEGVPWVKIWPAQGGWYALLEVTQAGEKDGDWVVRLLEKEKVYIQPGGFYDFEKGCFLVVSLLPQPDIFKEGIRRMARFFTERRSVKT